MEDTEQQPRLWKCRNGHTTPGAVHIILSGKDYALCARCYADWVMAHIPGVTELTETEVEQWLRKNQSKR